MQRSSAQRKAIEAGKKRRSAWLIKKPPLTKSEMEEVYKLRFCEPHEIREVVKSVYRQQINGAE